MKHTFYTFVNIMLNRLWCYILVVGGSSLFCIIWSNIAFSKTCFISGQSDIPAKITSVAARSMSLTI